MTVGIVGSGPAAAAAEAALGDVAVDTERRDRTELTDLELAVVVGQVGDDRFDLVNERALEVGLQWVAVELGGVGGIPIVDAAVAGFGPETGCYECLSGRVNANLDPQAEPAAAPAAHTSRFAGAVAGREAVRAVESDADIFGRVVVVPFNEREFLPLPNCACDTGRSRELPRQYVERDLDDSLTRAERGFDDMLGIVQEIGEAQSFPVPYYLAQSCDTAGFSDVSAARDAAGVAPDWDGAFMRALGEALERYCAGIYRVDNFETGTPAEIPNAVEPASFVTRTEPDGTEIEWVPGENLSTREEAMLPAEFVHFPPPSRRYRPPITTGLGLGNSDIEALLSGLYEVIERDATMLSWYSTFDPLELDVDDETFETMTERAASEGLSVTPMLVTQDIDVPVVAVAVHRDSWPRFALGSDADLDVAEAARSALAEALQNWMELDGMGEEAASDALGEIGRYAQFPETAREYIDTESTIPAGSVGPAEVPTGAQALDEVVARVTDAGLSAYAARTTTRDVERLGFEAVRVTVPEAQPMCFGETYFGERASRVPEELGFRPQLDHDHHPYP
ncbi:YcaO-like family protein [Halovenus salina]|uniref:YcaO-like family protein n=1 Tax=Halovenus salina TaxID=1510225 RepID=A0ABD5W2T8_9EURY|nr:YcaO-like family protein [Halovenus salina]